MSVSTIDHDDARAGAAATLARRLGDRFVLLLALLCLAYASFVAVRYASQPPLDSFGFRQSQTALSAYWIAQDGFKLAYETPVAGPPWSIPFEFPLYQGLVAGISVALHVPLDVTGRLLSFVFLLLILWPARAICRQLQLAPIVFPLFAALLLSSPLYLYWGRSFMIETAALFFSVAAVRSYIDVHQQRAPVRNAILFSAWMSLGILQKATTGLPVLAALALVHGWLMVRRPFRLPSPRALGAAVLLFGVPLAIGIAWTLYTDQVKALNPLGVRLTSSALSHWNWGSLDQRISPELYLKVIWGRMFERNLGGVLGLLVLAASLAIGTPRPRRWIVLLAAAMGLLPLFLFTNLHLIHDYYQSGNMLFLIFALAVALGDIVQSKLPRVPVAALVALVLVASNLHWFRKEMLPQAAAAFDAGNSREFAIGQMLQAEMPADQVFVAFGNDWSSTFAYMARRKSFTVPGFFSGYDAIARHPEQFVGTQVLGAVVSCPGPATPTADGLARWAEDGRHWKVTEVRGCYVLLPDTSGMPRIAAAPPAPSAHVQCEGNLDVVSLVPNQRALHVAGWTTISGREGVMPEATWISITGPDGTTRYVEAIEASRPDVNAFFGRADAQPMGFSKLAPVDAQLAGELRVGVVRRWHGHDEACQFEKRVTLPGTAP